MATKPLHRQIFSLSHSDKRHIAAIRRAKNLLSDAAAVRYALKLAAANTERKAS